MQSKNGSLTLSRSQVDKTNGEVKEKAESELLNFDNGEKFIPKGNCEYRQQGPYLICYSCPLQHAVWIGMNKMMIGISKDGMPILKKRDFKQG